MNLEFSIIGINNKITIFLTYYHVYDGVSQLGRQRKFLCEQSDKIIVYNLL